MPRVLQRLAASSLASRVDSALARYIFYPARCMSLRADLFHILDHGYSQLALGLPLKRTVVTCHDVIPLLASRGIIDTALPRTVAHTFRFRLACMRRARHIIADSEATKRALIEFAGIASEQITVIYPGVNQTFAPPDCALQQQRARQALRVSPSSKIVLHVGTCGRYKNLPAVLHAMVRLRSILAQPVTLIRVGSDLHADEWELVDSLNLRPHVQSLGRLEGDKALAELYVAADVLAFPSLWEGFGWPPLEAMACGLPVVVSDRGALPEVVGDAGLVVGAGDIQALAEAIGRVLTDEELRRTMALRGLQRAGQFTWAQCAAKTLAVYRNVAQVPCGRWNGDGASESSGIF